MTEFKKDRFKRIISLVLSVFMILSAVQVTVFADEIITHGYWTITNADDSKSGTAAMEVESGNYFTYVSPSTAMETNGTSGDYYCVKSVNSNGAASNGIVTINNSTRSYAYYKPTTTGTLTLPVYKAASDKVLVVSRTSDSGTSEAVCSFAGDGSTLPLSGDNYSASISGSIITVDVETEAGYTYYVTMTGSKMSSYGAFFVPYTTVSGTISDSYSLSEYNLKFTNKTTGTVTYADVNGTSYSVVLKPGYDYTAALTGTYATSYAISSDTRTVSVTATDDHTQTANLTIAESLSYYVSGSLTGFAEGYNISDLALTFTPNDLTSFETVKVTIDTDALTYEAQLAAGETYTLSMAGAYDYALNQTYTAYNEEGTDVSQDIAFSAVAKYAVSGGFLGLTQTRGEYTDLSVTPSAITFKNVDDGYTYSGTASEGAYSVSLRNGSYLASITADSYSTSTHVVVNGAAVSRDLLLKAETTESVEYADTLYVGSGRTYTTIQSAVDAVTNMSRTDDQRVTIMIDPGTYREQVYITTPNITLQGTGSSRDDTKITWYYGIGYNYYSCSDGYYDPYADYDKFAKGEPTRWGTAVITQSTATNFKAENITFENSFNKYMTDEELSDGVEPSGSSITVVRKETTNVDDRASTERAAAYVNYADKVEFYNCSFISSQDTLYTCNKAYDAYYRSCYIEGQTDFIYGDGNVIFDGCEINFCGYDGTKASGYITAQSASDTSNTEYGYIFRSCYVSYNSERDTTAGSFGRMWGNSAMVTFLDTQLQESDMILKEGWTDMSVAATASTVRLKEYNTTYNGTQVDTSGRVNGVVDSIDRGDYSVESVFIANGWTPSYYVTDSTTTPSFATAPTLSSNGDLNKPNPGETVTVSYELDQNGDASRISWYGVEYTPTYDDENVSSITTESLDTLLSTATLLYTSSAVSTNSYQIPMDCAGLYLLAVVTPITNYGLVGSPEFVVVSGDAVSSTWNDPSNPGSIAPGSGINIYLAGDSTVKDYSAKGMYNNGSILSAGSWGEFLQEFFDEDYVQVNDYAQGGRACRSFLNEGKLAAIMENIKAGDYLLMQFGHNDSASGEDYYIDRFVPLYTQDELPEDTENRSYGFPTIKPEESMKTASPSSLVGSYGDTYYAWDCGATYKGFLQEYIDEALAKGAIPVIVSPVARMYYNSDGSIKTHHDAGTSFDTTKDYYTTNNAYVTACEELYQENLEAGNTIYYIDGYEMTEKLYTDAWEACGSNEYGAAIMDVATSGIDSTHSNKTGGMIQAGLIAKWMQDADISLSDYVQQPVTVYGEETSGSYIFTIIDKIFTAKDKNLVEYEYWSNLGQELFDSIGGSSSVVYIDLDFSTEDAVALYETNADTTFTDGVYSGKYTNDSSQTFNVSVYQSGVQYNASTASYGTKVSVNKPVFSFTVSDAASYTVTFDPSVSDAETVGLYKDSSCTEAAATASLSDGSVTYNKTSDGEETLYFASADATNLYIKSFTISSEELPVNEVSLNFATDDAMAFYTDSSSYTDGVYSGEYTNSSGQTFDVSVYQSSIAYHTYDYGTKVTANKPIFSFTVSEPGYYTVDYVLSTAASATTVGLYKDSSCSTEAASAALADGSVTYTKTTSGEETLYFGSVDATNLYIKSFDISSEDLTVVSLTFNTADDYAAYVTNADTTFDDNDYYTGLYTNSDGQSFEVSIIESGIKYLSDGRYNYGTFLTAKKPVFCITLDEKAMYTITTTGTCNSTSTLDLYTESGCANSVASGDAPGSVIYKKTTDTPETLYVAASVSNNLYVQTFTVTKEELADETTQVYKGSVTGIETDDSNVQLTFKSSTDTVEVSAEEYSSTGATLIDNDTYTVTAAGEKGVYTGSVTTDGSGTADITLSRIEFDFPLDFVNNFDVYNTYLTAKGYSSADMTDSYSGITIHGSGIVLTDIYRSYGAKTNSYSIISFDAETTGKVTVNVGGCVTSASDTLQLLVNGEAGTDAVSASGNISLTADVTAGDTVTLYTPTRVNLYYKTIDVEYDAKAIKTIGGSRYIIFGISEEEAQNSSNFNVIQNNVSAVDSEGKAVDFDTVYEAVQFGETIMKAEDILGEGAKYVIAFMLSNDDANTSDTEILDGFDLDFN